jgi:hypothetical protein
LFRVLRRLRRPKPSSSTLDELGLDRRKTPGDQKNLRFSEKKSLFPVDGFSSAATVLTLPEAGLL